MTLAFSKPDNQSELAQKLSTIIAGAVEGLIAALREAAPIVIELDKQKFDYEGMPMTFVGMARRIGHGTLLPEFQRVQHTRLFEYAKDLTTTIQQSILDDEDVRVVDLMEPSIDRVRRVPFSKLSGKEMTVVFSPDGIRTIEQQIVECRNERQRHAMTPTAIVEKVVFKKNRAVLHGEFTATELKRFIKALEK